MAQYDFIIFAGDNFGAGTIGAGVLPSEDGTHMSNLVNGNTMTWLGGGETTTVTIDDPSPASFDEAASNQTLVNAVTFDGATYAAGQVVTPSYTITFSGSDGQTYTLSSFNFTPNTANAQADAIIWHGAVPPANTVLTVISESNPTGGSAVNPSEIVSCFLAGTLLDTKRGHIAVEELKIGDEVLTQDHGYQKIRWVCYRKLTAIDLALRPRLKPIRIQSGALGSGLPHADLYVSPQHRMLLRSKLVRRVFGVEEVLVAAAKLTMLEGIDVVEGMDEVDYYHFLFDEHEIIFSHGAATESMFLGSMLLDDLARELREELIYCFPEINDADFDVRPARFLPSHPKRTKALLERLIKNSKPLVEC